MFHMFVRTISGATYRFRWTVDGVRFYATCRGSSSGASITNMLVAPVQVERGERMLLTTPEGGFVLWSSPVEYWEMGRIDTDDAWFTSHDDEVEDHNPFLVDARTPAQPVMYP